MPSRGCKPSSRRRATRVTGDSPFGRVQAAVRKVPRGRVVTYAQLSELVDGRLTPIGVSWALRAADVDLPWHRVVSSSGKLSTEKAAPGEQRARLEAEGVQFVDGVIDLARFGWRPPRRRREANRP